MATLIVFVSLFFALFVSWLILFGSLVRRLYDIFTVVAQLVCVTSRYMHISVIFLFVYFSFFGFSFCVLLVKLSCI